MDATYARRAGIIHRLTWLTIFMLILTTFGCVSAPPPTPTIAPTVPPTITSQPTATATPQPTMTPTPTATLNRTATAAVKATESMAAHLAELEPELAAVGFPIDSGKLVLKKDMAISMTVEGYDSYWPESVVKTALKDFVLHVDVSWDSTSGLAGCGIMFRAEEDLERGAQYIFDIMRLSGAPNWEMYYRKFNTLQNEIVPFRFDDIIDDKPGAVNSIVLVVQGDLLQAYINGKKMREGRNSKISEGGIAYLTWQESGKSTCSFKNTWVWELDEITPTPSG